MTMSQSVAHNRFYYMLKSFTKSHLFLIALALSMSSASVRSQSLQVTLNLSPHPSMRISDWESHRETVTLVVINTGTKTVSAKINAILSLNGSSVASSKLDAMPVLSIPPGQSTFFGGDLFPQNAINFNGELKQTTIRTGILPEGSYELCVSMVGENTAEINVLSNHDCRSFFLAKYSLPTLLQPTDGSSVVAGLEPTILFSWTPLVPAPFGIVNYRLKLVELLPSQDAKQAILNNRPFFEKVATAVPQSNWPQEVPLPPDGGNFIWSIQPEDADGTPIILPERFAEPFKLIALPSHDRCMKLLSNVSDQKETLIKTEEKYWSSYTRYLRISKELQNAQARADAYEIKKLEKQIIVAEAQVANLKQSHEDYRSRYDQAISKYKDCIGK